MPLLRYYAEHTDLDPLFNSRHATGWQVFDREKANLLPQSQGNEKYAICFCINRREAFTIRDRLNHSIGRVI